jgi:hypothetical protein
MLPIFMIGLIVGIALSYAFYKFKEDTPSEIKMRAQDLEIERQKKDNKLLTDINERLYNKIDKLEYELSKLKNK